MCHVAVVDVHNAEVLSSSESCKMYADNRTAIIPHKDILLCMNGNWRIYLRPSSTNIDRFFNKTAVLALF